MMLQRHRRVCRLLLELLRLRPARRYSYRCTLVHRLRRCTVLRRLHSETGIRFRHCWMARNRLSKINMIKWIVKMVMSKAFVRR